MSSCCRFASTDCCCISQTRKTVNSPLVFICRRLNYIYEYSARFDRRILRRSSFDVPTVHSAIGVSLSLELGSGTVFRPPCAQPTCPMNGSNGHWRRFCLFETVAQLLLFCLRRAGYKFSDMYIHTYSDKNAEYTAYINPRYDKDWLTYAKKLNL